MIKLSPGYRRNSGDSCLYYYAAWSTMLGQLKSMETIFDYAPTIEEIEECGFLNGFRILWLHLDTSGPVTPASYFTTVTPELALFDLYLLFRERKDTFRMANYASQIPDLVQQYELGFDNLIIPV